MTAIAALAVFLIVAEAPLRELLRAGRYRALRANLKAHAPPLNLSRVLEVAGAERCVGDGRCLPSLCCCARHSSKQCWRKTWLQVRRTGIAV